MPDEQSGIRNVAVADSGDLADLSGAVRVCLAVWGGFGGQRAVGRVLRVGDVAVPVLGHGVELGAGGLVGHEILFAGKNRHPVQFDCPPRLPWV